MDNITGAGAVVLIGIWIAAIWGWVLNIIKMIAMLDPNAAVTGELVARIIGIPFGPLGVIMGLFVP
jgi:hypothetical protein